MTSTLRWWMAAAVVVVFLAGAAIGLFAGALHTRHNFAFRHGPRMGERMQQHLERELKLTPEQAGRIAPIIQRMSAQLDAVRQETSGRVSQIMEQSHREMVPLLTPDQQERLNEMRRRHQRMMHRHDGPPPND